MKEFMKVVLGVLGALLVIATAMIGGFLLGVDTEIYNSFTGDGRKHRIEADYMILKGEADMNYMTEYLIEEIEMIFSDGN